MNSVKYCIFPSLSLLLLITNCSGFFGSPSLKRSLNKVDEYLSKTVPSDDLDANSREATDKLREIEEKSQSCFSLHRRSNDELATGFRLLLELREVSASRKCNDETFKLLEKLDDAVGKPRENEAYRQPRRRVERLVYQSAKKHYELCYPDQVSPRFDQLKAATRECLMDYADLETDLIGKDQGAEEIVKLFKELKNGRNKYQKMTREDYESVIVRPCKELLLIMNDVPNPTMIGYDLKREASAKQTAFINCQKIARAKETVWVGIEKYQKKEEIRVQELYSRMHKDPGILPESNYGGSNHAAGGVTLIAIMGG